MDSNNSVNVKSKIKDFIVLHSGKIIIISAIVIFVLVTYFFGIGITLKEGKKIELLVNNESGANYTDPGYNASLYGIPLPFKVTTDGDVKVNKVGTYEITYTYKFIRTVTAKRTVNVVEKDAPVITLKGDTTVNSCPNGKFVEPGYSAYDTYDGDLTKKVETEVKDGKALYKVIDASGNVGTAERVLVFSDDIAPVIELTGGSEYSVFVEETYTDPGYKVTDNCLGDITSSVTVDGTVDTNTIGTYTLTYNVSDGTNTAQATRKVYVISKPANVENSSTPTTIGKIYKDYHSGVYSCTGIDTDYCAQKLTIDINFENDFATKVSYTYDFDGEDEPANILADALNSVPEAYSDVSNSNGVVSATYNMSSYLNKSYDVVVKQLTSELGKHKWQCK